MKIKITTGFSQDEKFIIDAEEAHKAYYLFNNPDMRGTFNNGVAIIGKNIHSIQPAWNETMGWNPTHKLDDFDWQEIKEKQIDKKLKLFLENGQKVAKLIENNPKLLNEPLSEVSPLVLKYPVSEERKQLSSKFQI